MRTIAGLAVLALVSVTASDAQEGATTPVPTQTPTTESSTPGDGPNDFVLFSAPYRDSLPGSDSLVVPEPNTGRLRTWNSTPPHGVGESPPFAIQKNELAKRFDDFYQTLEPTFDTIFGGMKFVAGQHIAGYSVEEIEIHVEVSADGRLFVARAGAMASVTLRLRRSDLAESTP